MSKTNAITYSEYLQIDRLLDLQQPVGTDPEPGGELFFIVAHQASELWLKSLLVELVALDEAIARRDPPCGAPMLHARRALAGAEMLVAGVEALRSLDAETLLRFRPHLGNASGAQSSQFATLRALVGLGRPTGGPIEAKLRAVVPQLRSPCAGAVGAGTGPEDEWFWLVDTLLDLSTVLWRWGVYHLEVVQRLIAARPGTGGTSGAHFLAGRLLERPFPTLWSLRSQA